MRLNNDKEFAADAIKTWATCRNTTPAPDTNDAVRNALTVRPEIRTFVADYIKQLGK